MKKLLILVSLLLLTVSILAQPIRLNSTNPRYFTYNNEDFIIATSAEHYGAVLNLDFDYVTYLNQLAADGMNGTRLCAGANVEWPGWFSIDENTWAPVSGSYIAPWARSSTPGYYNGGNKFDLTQWDEAYFTRLEAFMTLAEQLDIIVQLFFFTTVYNPQSGGDPELWDYCPMNIINNVNGIGNVTNAGVYDITNTNLMAIQNNLVAEIVTRLNDYDNLIYEPANEPYISPGVGAGWEDAIIATITATEMSLPKKHLISLNVNNFSYTITNPNPDVSLFDLHYANSRTAYTDNYGVGKALGCNETGFSQNDLQYRQELIVALWSGAAEFNILDYSFTVGDEEGTVLPVGNPSGGGPTLRTQTKYIKEFFESLNFVNMAPDNSFVNSVSDGVQVFGMAEAGEQYSVGFKDVTAFAQLNIPAEHYTVQWMDTKTGQRTTEQINHLGGNVTLTPPAYSDDIVLKVIRTDLPPAGANAITEGGKLVVENGAWVYEPTGYVPEPPPPAVETIVFEDTFTWTWPVYTYGGYGFYWWHRTNQGRIDYGDMPIDDWTLPNDYYNGTFDMEVTVVSQPTSEPFYIQFGIWQDDDKGTAHPETVAARQYLTGGNGSSGSWTLGSPNAWWQKEVSDPVDFARPEDFYRIGIVLWNADPLCIPKGAAWGDDGCPEFEADFFPLEVYVKVTATPIVGTPNPPDPPGPEPDDQVTLFEIDFESTAIQDPYAYTTLISEWPFETNWTNGRSRTSYVSGEYTDQTAIRVVDASNVLVCKYPANAYGVGTEWDNTTVGTGINAELGFEAVNGIDEVYLTYNAKFQVGFDWGLGGKMPGVKQYPFSTTFANLEIWSGSSLRFMWQPNGGMHFYDYTHFNYDYEYGQGPQLGPTFVADVWYNITQRFVNSDVGSYNGIHEIFIDGVLAYSWTGLRMRRESNIGWNFISLAWFQGGGDASYATPGYHEIYSDDYKLWYISGDGTAEHPVGKTASPVGRDISEYIIMK